MKKLWILNHHSGLDVARLCVLPKERVPRGREVGGGMSCFTHGRETYAYDEEVKIRKVKPGITYVFLHTAPAYHGISLNRILNMMDYCRLMKKYEKAFYKKFGVPDLVIGSSVHPFAWESAWAIAKKNRIPFICEIRDFWPLSLTEIFGTSKYHPACLMFSLLERRAYRHADAIVSTMEFGYRYLGQFPYVRRDRIYWIPNGYHTEEIDEVLAKGEVELPEELDRYLNENWCAVYTGSFVDSERLFDMLDAAKWLQEQGDDKIRFAFIGNGYLEEDVKRRVQEEGLKNVRIFPRIQKSQVAVALSKAKVCIAALRDDRVLNDLGLSLNKLNDYLYSGNPTVFACGSVNVVGQSGGGIVVPPGDKKAYAEALQRVYRMTDEERRAMGERGRREIREKYSYSLLARQYMDIFEEVEG
ncbi:MAG: glycosyltransferase family 4 protein [Lachnospiraceae bacterium]|nr:glycosyltransferase family 4 protein [Lachnospiraceae bacterium]